MQHTVVALMHDRPGVLTRIVSLFRRRAVNIDSLSVATTEHPGRSRMTVVVQRDDVHRVIRQLERLVDVLAVHDVTGEATVMHELCLVRCTPAPDRQEALAQVARAGDARIVHATASATVLAVTGTPDEVSATLARLEPFAITALTRAGRIAMPVAGPPAPTRATPPGGPFTWQADGALDEDAA